MSASCSEAERRSILDGLESADEEVRRLAVEQLLLLPATEASTRLAGCLGDASWRVRKAAIERIVACRDQQRVQEMLIEALADGENPGRRNAAFQALVACGTRVTARLVAELASDDVDVRKLVVDALAAIGDPEVREPLAAALGDPDANVRAAAAEALGVVGGPGELDDLLGVATASSEDVLVRLSALRALAGSEAEVALERLGDVLDQSLLRPAAFELLGYSRDPAAEEALRKGLANPGRSTREAAMAALLRLLARLDADAAHGLRGRIREAALADDLLVESACDRLLSADLGTRMVLIQFLGLLEDERAALPILEAGRDEAIEELADATLEALGDGLPGALERGWNELALDLRSRACALLGRIGGETAEGLLVDALGVADSELRCEAALALGSGGFFGRLPDLVHQLEVAARDEGFEAEDEVDAMVRAIVQLAERSEAATTGRDVQVIEVLSSRLGGAPEPVRLAIAQVLARLGREQDGDVLDYLLKDESPGVRRAAVSALERFTSDRARDSLRVALGDEASAVRIAAAHALGNADRPEAAEDLAQLLTDEDAHVVSVAVRAMGRLFARLREQDEIAYARIAGVLSSEEPLVVLAGLEALQELGGPRAGSLATCVLSHVEPDVVRAAAACVGTHADLAELGEMIGLISHADWSVRAEVVQILADRGLRKCLPAILRRLDVEEDPFVRESMLAAIRRLEE